MAGRTTGLMSLRGQMFGLVGNSTSRMFLQKELTRVVVQPVTVSRQKNAAAALSLYEGELERVIVFEALAPFPTFPQGKEYALSFT